MTLFSAKQHMNGEAGRKNSEAGDEAGRKRAEIEESCVGEG